MGHRSPHSVTWGSLVILMSFAATAWTNPTGTAVQVVNLSVDGRTDTVLGIGNTHPTLGWQFTPIADCTEQICPADRQTAYQVQAASSTSDLESGQLLWDTGKVDGNAHQVRFKSDVGSRVTVAWRVQVWDALGNPSGWSAPSGWSVGLLDNADWGDARWIDYPDRESSQPLPLFVRQFALAEGKDVASAIMYLSGVGLHHATVNGEEITDEVIAPGYSNYQLSSEYRTYDVRRWLRPGENAIGVSMGHGTAFVRRDVLNPAVGRTAPYSWWQSRLTGNGTLTAGVQTGATVVQVSNTSNYFIGGTINIDTGAGGDNLESRVITAIDNTTNTINFTPSLGLAHQEGVKVTGSGNNIASVDPSAGAAVTPRLIGRLEINYSDGTADVIVTNRSWRATLGPLVTDNWYSGPDYDARREIAGWNRPGADINSSDWVSAGIAPPPNLATKLLARAAEPVVIKEQFVPVNVTNPFSGVWVFDFGQNFAGWALVKLPELPAGTVIKVAPAEGLNANGTVNQESLGPGSRGTDLFYTCTTAGRPGGESWHPEFSYFGMQWVEVTGLPNDFTPGPELITGLRLQGSVPDAGTFNSSDARINRIHKMARYSFMSNLMSVFTDCPGREKLSYPADYTMTMGALYRNFNFAAFMRTTMLTLVEGQSIADTYMAGNVALKTPVYDWGYTRQFGDEINWGNAIVLVPSLLHDLYGDTTVMEQYYDQMVFFVDYIIRQKVENNLVVAALADWVAADERTTSQITGTWGWYLTIKAMARMANLTGHADDAVKYAGLEVDIYDAFNAAFYNDDCGCYAANGSVSAANATQADQALALDAGLVPEAERGRVLSSLVNLTENWNSSGPHLSGGTIGLGPIVRALVAGGHDELLYSTLQESDEPSYGDFMASTAANPGGLTTLPERWDIEDSKNHMILAQIEEWFHSSIAGIRPLAFGTFSTLWEDGLVIQPVPVAGLTSAEGTYVTPLGEVRSAWTRAGANFTLEVTVPPGMQAEVRVPGTNAVRVAGRALAVVDGSGEGYSSFSAPVGTHSFTATL